jgi:AraC family transcriptional regulator of adaptative response / DNA-3-methyladenine glycosylase II
MSENGQSAAEARPTLRSMESTFEPILDLDAEACYAAVCARDGRFDGQFFTAVRTTGIFCRPICTAKTPARRNVDFYRTAAAAQEAGFRPCLRCRPERAPNLNPMLFSQALFKHALAAVHDGALDVQSVDDLAGQLGVTERHLRRLFEQHLGASPVAVATMRRALLAKQLLDENDMPLTQVAFAAGFNSVRRFNEVMRRVYRDAPSILRRLARENSGAYAANQGIVLYLPYRAPLAWDALAGYLGRRAIGGVEAVQEGVYRRVWRSPAGACNAVAVAHAPERHAVRVTAWLDDARALSGVMARVRRLFDLDTDTEAVQARLCADERLAPVVRRCPGLRVPGAWDGFELAVRAILGQQISVAAASTLARRLAERHGSPLPAATLPAAFAGLERAFPEPAALAAAELQSIGLTAARARNLAAFAAAVAARPAVLDSVEELLALPGIGPWTAQYVAMRAHRDPNAFPGTDLGVRKAIARLYGVERPADIEAVAQSWAPWRAYAVLHCWTSLEKEHDDA